MDRAVRRNLNFSGTKLQFMAPQHNHPRLPFTPLADVFNLYSNPLYSTIEGAKIPIPLFSAYIDDWVLHGIPLIQGEVGGVDIHLYVQWLPEFTNLFIPRHLEKAIEHTIYARFGPGSDWFESSCRMDWRIIKQGDTHWVNYRNNEIDKEWFWQTPLTDEHLLTARFRTFNRANKPDIDKAMLRFCQTIMESFHIQLSADALSQRTEARKQYPHQTLSEFLPKLEWAEKRVEDEDQVFFRLIDANPKKNERIFLPDGNIDRDSEAKEREKVEREAKKIVEQQEKTLKETMAKTLASHLDFDE